MHDSMNLGYNPKIELENSFSSEHKMTDESWTIVARLSGFKTGQQV